MDCREGYELSNSGACVPAPLFNAQLFSSIDATKQRSVSMLPTCEIVETCSPAVAARQCSIITNERETAECKTQEFTDSWGRKRVEETNCGQSQPYKITVTSKGEKPIEFLFDGKEYRAEYKNDKGERIGYIGYVPKQEYIYYHNNKTNTSFTDMQDGTHVSKKVLSKDDFERTFSKDGKVFTTRKRKAVAERKPAIMQTEVH